MEKSKKNSSKKKQSKSSKKTSPKKPSSKKTVKSPSKKTSPKKPGSKKTVKPPSKKKKGSSKKYFLKNLEIIVAAGAATAGLIALQNLYNGQKESYAESGYEALAFARDTDDDDYDGEIPVYDEGQLIGLLEDGSVVLVGPEDNESDGQYNVMGITNVGEILQGTTDQGYLNFIEGLSIEEIEDHTKHLYEVTSEDHVNVRSSTVMDKQTKIGTMPDGELFWGGEYVVSKDNDFMWVPIFYINDDGEFQVAYVCSDYVERIDTKDAPKEENKIEKKVVNTSNANFVDLNLRSARVINSESYITGIPHGDVVETTGKDEIVENGVKWVEVKYVAKDGKEYIGWVAEGYLEDHDLVEYVVDIEGSPENRLNVREEPGLESDVIATIEDGTRLKIQKSNIENAREVDGFDWVRVELSDGTHGNVALEYLKEYKEENKKEESSREEKKAESNEKIDEILKNIRVNKNGKVVGLDVSTMTPDQLRYLLTADDAIPTSCYSFLDKATHRTEDVAGKTDYVYIKIGARGFGKEGKMVDNGDNYLHLAKVCEELGIPYGFYFYSTSLNTKEADEDIAFVRKLLSEVEDRDYYLLPFALDVETCEGSRLIGHDVTDVMAYWANQAEPYFGKVVLYTDARHLANCADKLIDINRYNEQLISGPTQVWLVGMRDADTGKVVAIRQRYTDEIADDTDIWMSQCLLDMLLRDDFKKADINIIDEERFIDTLRNGTLKAKEDNIARIDGEDNGERNF